MRLPRVPGGVQDYERMMEERHNGHLAAFLGFLVAFTFDVLDVLAHIVVVVGLLHQHFQVRAARSVSR
jgi:hypothetical protein